MEDNLGESRNGDGADMGNSVRHVASWDIPAEAVQTEAFRYMVLLSVEMGFDRPEDLANLALAPMVATIGQLEVKLAAAVQRIADLERRIDGIVP